MTFSLKELILNGDFGGIELEMPREAVENIIGTFDDWWDSGNRSEIIDGIGRHGTLEFHFMDNELTLIWCDNLSHLYAGNVDFDSWFLKTAANRKVDNAYSFSKLAKKLIKAKADFSVKHDEYNFIVTVVKSGATLYFENHADETNRNKFYLVAFGKSIYTKPGMTGR